MGLLLELRVLLLRHLSGLARHRLGLAAEVGERDGEQLDVLVARVVHVLEGEHEAIGLDDLAVDAEERELAAVVPGDHGRAPRAARPDVHRDRGERRGVRRRAEPVREVLGLRPGLPDELAGCVEDAGDGGHPASRARCFGHRASLLPARRSSSDPWTTRRLETHRASLTVRWSRPSRLVDSYGARAENSSLAGPRTTKAPPPTYQFRFEVRTGAPTHEGASVTCSAVHETLLQAQHEGGT